MKLRLAARLMLSHVFVVFITIALAGVLLLAQTRKYFENAERSGLLVQARVAANSCNASCLSAHSLTANIDGLQLPSAANVAQVQSNSASNLVVSSNGDSQADQQGQLVASLSSRLRVVSLSDPIGGRGESQSDSSVLALALAGRASTSNAAGVLRAAAPILRGGDVVGAVEVRSNSRDINVVMFDLRRRFLWILAGSAIVGALIGFLRARSIAKPLKHLTEATNSIAQGCFDVLVPENAKQSEVSELGQSFNMMQRRVQSELSARESFIADASHELRTPLTAIRGTVELLQGSAGEKPETRKRFLASLSTETERLMVLAERLLTLQTIDQGSAEVDRPVSVNVSELTDECRSGLLSQAMLKDVTIAIDLVAEANPVVSGDPVRLGQVFTNLLSNAVAHAPHASVVTVRVLSDLVKHQAVVDVIDRGPGIPVADRERVFERFVRLDSSRSRQLGGGSGLGLSIARGIARTYGGDVLVIDASAAPWRFDDHNDDDNRTNPGCIVRVTLPLAP
jgi:two-component system, OmpR family, sensor kinase